MPACSASAKASIDTLQNVKEYYGKVLETSKDLKTSACTAAGRPHRDIVKIIREIPNEVKAKFYGCGAPLPLGIDGLRVLDLGSGSGRDCYVASSLVGEQGMPRHSHNSAAGLCIGAIVLSARKQQEIPFIRLLAWPCMLVIPFQTPTISR
jgi:hypothetical protein